MDGQSFSEVYRTPGRLETQTGIQYVYVQGCSSQQALPPACVRSARRRFVCCLLHSSLSSQLLRQAVCHCPLSKGFVWCTRLLA
jgi:hypothetical protein